MAEYEDVAAVARSAYAEADGVASPQIGYRFALALAGFGTPVVAFVTFAVAWSIAVRHGGVTNTDNGFSLVGIALVILNLLTLPFLLITTVVGMITGGTDKPHWVARSIVIFISGSLVALIFGFVPAGGTSDGFPTGPLMVSVGLVAALLSSLPAGALLLQGFRSRVAPLSDFVAVLATVVVLAALLVAVITLAMHGGQPFWWTNVP